jgi:hypothetical protein
LILTFLLWAESLFEVKTLFVSLQPWYTLSKSLNNSWWNYFYSFFLSNFVGVVLYQDFLYNLNSLYEVRSSYYCRFELISSALVVGYNNIHPPLFYLFLWTVLTLALEERFMSTKALFCLGTVVFYWGSLWGVGNAAWGYFWVKDAIELMLLIALVLLIIFFHTPANLTYFLRLCILLFIIAIILLLLRWGLIFTRHSFFNLLATVNFSKFYLIFFHRLGVRALALFFIYSRFFEFFWVVYALTFLLTLLLLSPSVIKRYLFFHTFLLVCGLSWLKYQPHNFTIYETLAKAYELFYGITAKAACSGFHLVSITLHTVKSFAVYSVYYSYAFKSIIADFTVYISWSRFFLSIVFLISIRRFTVR